MKRNRIVQSRKCGERGQVLILAVVALVLVIIAILLLFDVQTIIRGKIKGQNAADAAALTAAKWQKHSLNLIGELNLVRATGMLISDPYFETAVMETYRNAEEYFFDSRTPIRNRTNEFLSFPEREEFLIRDEGGNVVGLNGALLFQEVNRVEKERFYLDTLDRLVSQLQTRISFVGPLLGFGAAQQAAKNNGLSFDSDTSDFFTRYVSFVGGNEYGMYEQFTPEFVNDYAWRGPYAAMLESILDYSAIQNDLTGHSEGRAYGLAAGTTFRFTGMPNLVANPPSDFTNLLGDKSFYDSILGRNWCELDDILELDFSGNWWSDFECDYESSFSRQSEILPLHISFSYYSPEDANSRTPYSKPTDPLFDASDHLGRFTSGNDLITQRYRDRTSPYEHGFEHTYQPLPSSTEEKRETQVTISTSPFSPYPRGRSENREDASEDEWINTWDIFRSDSREKFTEADMVRFIDRFMRTYNDDDEDRLYTPLPVFSWALYDEKWTSFGGNSKQEWEGYLEGRFKPGMDYHSGALSYFETQQQTVTISGTMGRTRGTTGHLADGTQVNYENTADIGDVFANTAAGSDARGVSNALSRMNYNLDKIRTTALAKPIGRLKTDEGYLRPFEAGRMVLPIFTETALTPIALDPVDGISMLDIDWYYYLTEFVPLLSGSSSLQDAWERAAREYPNHTHYFRKYYNALLLIGNEGFRQAGINWLNTVVVWEKDAKGNRIPVKTNRDVNCHGSGGIEGPGGPLH